MRRVLGGAVLVIAGIAAFIEAYSHAPEYICPGEYTALGVCSHEYLASGHLSQTAYDLLRIGGSALVIVGGLGVVMGLIRYWRTQGQEHGRGDPPMSRVLDGADESR